ncbi:short-chain fatty acid transporter [Paracoccaceae bacterium GXU_MW_L88]
MSETANRSPLMRVVHGVDAGVQRWLPDPFVIVLLLTVVVFVCGMIFEGQGPAQMATHWGDGFWSLLSFAMQMMLVLVTGHVMASTPLLSKLMNSLARLASTPAQAIVLVTVVALAAAWINWGFGLVVGALFARAVGRHVPDTDYRVLIAAAYSGFVIWHGGFSGSIPLTIATPEHFLAEMIGVIPTSQTIFALYNLIIVAVLVVTIPMVNRMMLNHGGQVVRSGDVDLGGDDVEDDFTPTTPAERLENSRIVSLLAAAIGLLFIVLYFARNGFALNLNIVNMIFLFVGLALHKSPRAFTKAVQDAIGGAAAILVQFPFYAGIMGMMAGSGMAADITSWFTSISTASTLPVIAFLSGGFVNVLVPSGGGQWAVQGPIMMETAQALGADPARVAMGVAWGDAWTNMIQPFWALPALAIAGLSARDIMGFCLILVVLVGVVVSAGLMLIPALP